MNSIFLAKEFGVTALIIVFAFLLLALLIIFFLATKARHINIKDFFSSIFNDNDEDVENVEIDPEIDDLFKEIYADINKYEKFKELSPNNRKEFLKKSVMLKRDISFLVTNYYEDTKLIASSIIEGNDIVSTASKKLLQALILFEMSINNKLQTIGKDNKERYDILTSIYTTLSKYKKKKQLKNLFSCLIYPQITSDDDSKNDIKLIIAYNLYNEASTLIYKKYGEIRFTILTSLSDIVDHETYKKKIYYVEKNEENQQ